MVKGMKKTEIGLIPEDWEVKKLGELSTITGGGTPKTNVSHYWNGNINWFTPTEIGDKKYVDISIRKISKAGLDNSSAKLLPRGTILLSTRASIGDCAILLNEACTNQGFQSLIAHQECSTEFLYYLIETLKVQLIQNASGSTFLEISPNKVRELQVPLPPLPEQEAIAGALSDADAWIESLEQIIAKKRLIKQGAMQELLTPKEGWEVKKLGDFNFDISDGNYSAKYPKSSEFRDNGIPFIRAVNIKNYKVVNKDLRYISPELHNELLKGHLKKGDILITNRGDIGQIALVGDDFIDANINAQIVRINTNQNLIDKYLLYWLSTDHCQNKINDLQTGSALKQLPINNLKKIEIKYPSLTEQTRIATILSDMDAELEALEQRLHKARQIKQGMMQELLTGRIRLLS